MILQYPIWLLMLVPAGVLLFMFRLPTRMLIILRASVMVALVFALCRPMLKIQGKTGTVVVIADRSESIPVDDRESQEEIVKILQSSMGKVNRLAVVTCGRRSAVEQPPQREAFAGFFTDVGVDQSNLAEGMESALSLIPESDAGRIVFLTDGRWTGRNPEDVAVRCAARGIPVDFRLQERVVVNDVAIQELDFPNRAMPGEAYIITAWIQSPISQKVKYSLKRGNTVIAAGSKDMDGGLNRLMFRDKAESGGTANYKLVVAGEIDDPVPENNVARMLIGVEGERPVLCITPDEGSSLFKLLKKGGVSVVRHDPGRRLSLDELSGYSAVLIENVSSGDVGLTGMMNIAAWVKYSGAGFVMTGGRNSYGPGGYFKSPLDKIMPVSMEIRTEHRKFAVAIGVVLDRSGSMGMDAGGGKTKMDLANLGTAELLGMLSDMDEIGVIAVDSTPHVIVEMNTVANNRAYEQKIRQMESKGGGIFIYEGLSAGTSMLMKSESDTRHIILFSDAADSEQPGNYQELLSKCKDAGITVSVIGLGTKADCDADLLIDIAKLGSGECFFTDNAMEIPRLFAQDTFTITRSSMIEEETPLKFTGGYSAISSMVPGDVPPLGGYNLCYLRPGANMSAVTLDEYNAPVLASWYAGSGRVLCYTGEAGGEFSGPIAGWNKVGDFFSSITRWAAGEVMRLPVSLMLTHKLDGNICRVRLQLDPDREKELVTKHPEIDVLHGVAGKEPEVYTTKMRWVSADELVLEIPVEGRETVLPTVRIDGFNPVTLPPVCLPYSTEFKPPVEGRGETSLRKIANSTKGKERADLAGIWDELPTKLRFVDITYIVVLMGLGTFLLEILQRRTGILTLIKKPAVVAEETSSVTSPPKKAADSKKRFLGSISVRKVKSERIPPVQKGQPKEAETPEIVAEQSAESTLDAMKKARKRAGRRSKR